ncbi:uncharacterized protein LOC134196053 [Corticium candelabrum]|uniref:uncharacterized protein LOC134196053 n=1 Tax=Corticium candelabrum TaxID=121492 RepID=UPI002E258ADA|nr:uncharacterized protein LOC134196053 [Corticium candelabrum]
MTSISKLNDLHGHGVPITVRRAGKLVYRHAIQVRRGDGDGTYDVITVCPGLGSSGSGSQVRRLSRDEWAKSWLGDPAQVQYTEFPDRNTYDHDEIAKRAELALEQDSNGVYLPAINSDKHFVKRMAVRLGRNEWDKSPSEVVTDKAIARVRVYSPHLELDVGDVVYVLRYNILGFQPYCHVGVVQSMKPEIRIFHYNRQPPLSDNKTDKADVTTSASDEAVPKGYLHTTPLQQFLKPSGVNDRGLYRAVFMDGTTRTKKDILDRIRRFEEEKDPEIFHEWAGLDPKTSPHLETAYNLVERNCETVIFRLVRAEYLTSMSPQVHEWVHKGTVGIGKVLSATKDVCWLAKGPIRLALRRIIASSPIVLAAVSETLAGCIAGVAAGAFEVILLIGTLAKNKRDHSKKKISEEEYAVLWSTAFAEIGVGMGGVACITGTTIAFGFLGAAVGGPVGAGVGIACGVLTGIPIMVATFLAKRKVRSYKIKKGVKEHTSKKEPTFEEAVQMLTTEHADKFPKQVAPFQPTDQENDQQCHVMEFWVDDKTGELQGQLLG